MIQGASTKQLEQLEKICDDYLERIRVAKGKDPKKLVKKLTECYLPVPEDDRLRCKVGIMTKKMQVAGEKPTYFPHELRLNEITKEVEWVADGDDKVNKDKLRRSKIISQVDRTVEIEMVVNKKIVQFPDVATLNLWTPKLSINLIRTLTHK